MGTGNVDFGRVLSFGKKWGRTSERFQSWERFVIFKMLFGDEEAALCCTCLRGSSGDRNVKGVE